MKNSGIIDTTTKPNLDDQRQGGGLIVDFPTNRHRRQEERQVRFASHPTVQPIHSVLAMCSKQDLWYSGSDKHMMKLQMNRDAYELAQTLLSPSDKVLQEGIDISQAVGLEKVVNPIERKRVQKTMFLQRRAVISRQDEVQDEDELRRISERFSRASSERARTLAVHWVELDKK